MILVEVWKFTYKVALISTVLTDVKSCFAALAVFIYINTFLSDPLLRSPLPSHTHTRTKLFGTEDYVFHNWRVLCNYQMREEETERQIFGLMCRGGRLWSFAGS